MSIQAFGPRGNTANIAVSQASSTPVQVKSSPTGCYTYQFVNEGSSKCFFSYAVGKGGAAAPVFSCTIPTPGAPANGIPILPNEIVIYNLLPDAWFAAICESGETTNLLVTPGEGM